MRERELTYFFFLLPVIALGSYMLLHPDRMADWHLENTRRGSRWAWERLVKQRDMLIQLMRVLGILLFVVLILVLTPFGND